MAREKFPSDETDRLMVRFPPGLRDRIKAAADANGRSMNAEIVGALSRAYPKSGTALEKVAELFSVVQLNSGRINQDDMAVIYELFQEIEADVGRLQKLDTLLSRDDETGHRDVMAELAEIVRQGGDPFRAKLEASEKSRALDLGTTTSTPTPKRPSRAR